MSEDIIALVAVGVSVVSVFGTLALGILGWVQGRASATKAAVEAMDVALNAERERREELEGKVEILTTNELEWITRARECTEHREELMQENRKQAIQIDNLKRQIARLTKELDHLKKQLFGDGTDTEPID